MTTFDCPDCGASRMSEVEVCPCSRTARRRVPGNTDGAAALKAIMRHQSSTMDGVTAWRAIWDRRDATSLDPDEQYLVVSRLVLSRRVVSHVGPFGPDWLGGQE